MSDLLRFPENRQKRVDNLRDLASRMGIEPGIWETANMAPLDRYTIEDLKQKIEVLGEMLTEKQQQLERVNEQVKNLDIIPQNVETRIKAMESEINTISFQLQLRQAHLLLKEHNVETNPEGYGEE